MFLSQIQTLEGNQGRGELRKNSIDASGFTIVRIDPNKGEPLSSTRYFAVDFAHPLNISGGISNILPGYPITKSIRRLADIEPLAVKVPKEINPQSFKAAEKDALYTPLLIEGAFSCIAKNTHFVFMPYFQNAVSLAEVVERFHTPPQCRQIPFTLRFKFFAQIVEQLCRLHAKGIAHCDIKPANVLLLYTMVNGYMVFEDAQLIDPGIAQHLKTKDPRERHALDHICGSNSYIAPEVWSKTYALNSDMPGLFAVAAMLFGSINTLALKKQISKPCPEYFIAGYGTKRMFQKYDIPKIMIEQGQALLMLFQEILLTMKKVNIDKRASSFQMYACCRIIETLWKGRRKTTEVTKLQAIQADISQGVESKRGPSERQLSIGLSQLSPFKRKPDVIDAALKNPHLSAKENQSRHCA